jgi:Domain of unknown function (DUF4111)/Nucleotidyltransferase domain
MITPRPSGAPTAYPDLNAVLQELLSGTRSILGAHFVGMYLDGSLAIGDFDPDTSDIDFVVVTEADVSSDTFEILKTMHQRIADRPSKWGRELEGSYISRRALRHDRRPAAHPYVDRGSVLAMVQPETGYWTIHRHVLHDHGVALAGPLPRTLIDPVASDDLREAVRGILREWWTPMLTEGPLLQNGFYRGYAVLTMCRMLYTLRHGTIVTKPVAARWVQDSFTRWTPLIERALAWSRDIPPDLTETLALIQHTTQFAWPDKAANAMEQPLAFASSHLIDRYESLAREFLPRVLDLDYDECFISDRSSLWDFHDGDSNDALYRKISDLYGVDVSDVHDATIAGILEKIAAHRND